MNPVRSQTPEASAESMIQTSNGVKKAVKNLDFELAAKIRDRINPHT